MTAPVSGTVVRRHGGIVLGEIRGLVRAERAPNTPGAVWVFWDTGVLIAEDPAQLEIVDIESGETWHAS